MKVQKTLENILLTEIIYEHGKKSLTPDEDLLEQRYIDSLGLMKLINSMEEAFRITIGDDDIIPANFQNLNQMVAFVDEKMANQAA